MVNFIIFEILSLRIRIACWNVHTLGTLSDQSAQLLAAIKTMNERRRSIYWLSLRPIGQGMVLPKYGQQPYFTLVVSHFQYLGSIALDDCGSALKVDSRICKASKASPSLSRILWYQQKIKSCTKLRILNAVIRPTLLYDLERTVFS